MCHSIFCKYQTVEDTFSFHSDTRVYIRVVSSLVSLIKTVLYIIQHMLSFNEDALKYFYSGKQIVVMSLSVNKVLI